MTCHCNDHYRHKNESIFREWTYPAYTYNISESAIVTELRYDGFIDNITQDSLA
jgi:hypothetical protein